MNEASRWRIDFARELSTVYAARPGVKMIVLGGSPSRGLADEYSDLDIVVYWDSVDTSWLDTVPLGPAGADRKFYRKMGDEDVWLESNFFGPLKADLGHTTLDLWKKWTDSILSGLEINPPVQKSISGFTGAIPLFGQELHRHWCEKLSVYPEGLAEKMVRAHLGFHHKGVLDGQALLRGDVVFFYDAVAQTLKRILGILAGLNRVWFCPSEPRWIEYELSKMSVKPADAWPRIREILEGDRSKAAARLEALVDETLDLVEKQMPQVDISRIRNGFNRRVEPCTSKPALAARPD